MPDGGLITIRTANAPRGTVPSDLPASDYVVISVTDTGTGMSEEVLSKAVDPFFSKDGAGAVLPIKITGTRQNPSFGLELRRKKEEDQSYRKTAGRSTLARAAR